jgi:hypothetical protein
LTYPKTCDLILHASLMHKYSNSQERGDETREDKGAVQLIEYSYLSIIE